MKERKGLMPEITLSNWDSKDVPYVHEELCNKNWAPWLVIPRESVEGRIRVFPGGQLLARNEQGVPVGYAFINRVNWDGSQDHLKSWKDLAGNPTTFEDTYRPDGNTLCLMSINVHRNLRGVGIAQKLIRRATKLSKELKVEYLIGSFRPNQYGKAKLDSSDFLDFETYCSTIRSDGLPVDEWLRNLTRNGMRILKVDSEAMKGKFSLEEFQNFRTSYNPHLWIEIPPNIWECGEVGQWRVDQRARSAVYIENAIWGQIYYS